MIVKMLGERHMISSKQAYDDLTGCHGVTVCVRGGTVITPRYVEGLAPKLAEGQVTFLFESDVPTLYLTIIQRTLSNMGFDAQITSNHDGGIVLTPIARY